MGVIKFHSSSPAYKLGQRNRLKKFLHAIAEREGEKIGRLNYFLCSDEELLDINKRFLKHDTYTDIITFPYSSDGEPIQSDIYISYERVQENASHFSVSVNEELHRVIFHGLLHLLGYGDKSPKEQSLMRQNEDEYLKEYL